MHFVLGALSIFLVATGWAWAETIIRLPTEKLPVGTVLIYEYPSGRIHARRVALNDGNSVHLHVLSTWPDDPVSSTMIFDSRGLTQKVDRPTGVDWMFEPHNCYRVVGDCRFVFKNSDGGVFHRVYSSEFLEGVLTATVMNESGHVLEIHELTYDADGMLQNLASGKPGDVKQIMKLIDVVPPRD